MKTFSTQAIRAAVLAAVAVAVVVGTTSAQARDNVQFSVSVGAPGYIQPAPAYVRPAPVYGSPAPFHAQRGGAWGDRDRDGVPNIYDRNDRRHPDHGHRDARRGPYGDADRDGVPNRFDRFPMNPYYR